MESIHPVKDYDSYCEQCFVQFDKSWMLDQHLSKVHGATINLKTDQKSCENEENKENSSYVRFISYLKCSNCRQILKLSSDFGCLFTFFYFHSANLIKTDLHICNLWNGQFVT